jgi:hypothetical protein
MDLKFGCIDETTVANLSSIDSLYTFDCWGISDDLVAG